MQAFALILGVVFLAVGVLGFIPGLLTMPPVGNPAVDVWADGSYGLLFGLFPVNWIHNIFHLAFGVWGVAAARTISGSLVYARVTAVVYGVLVVMGFIPGLATVFGFIPIYGHDIWLHALIAVAAAYFGWGYRTTQERAASPTYRAR